MHAYLLQLILFWVTWVCSQADVVHPEDSVVLELMMAVANIPFVSLHSIRGQGREEEACCATDDPSIMFQQLGICACQWEVQQRQQQSARKGLVAVR
jgi:hypothetical protein